MHKMTCFWFFLWMFGFSPFRPFCLAANTDEIEIGLILDGPYGQEHSLIDNIKKEILDLLGDEFTVQFPASKTVQADWTLAGINKAINDLWFDSDVDLIIPLGIISGNELCRKQDLPKPVIVPYVLDAEAQKLSSISGTSGKTNLDYISVPSTFKKDIQLFKEIIDFHNLGIIISQYYLDALPELAQNIPKMFPGLEVSVVSLAASLKDALLQIPV
jgi:outer membrane protein